MILILKQNKWSAKLRIWTETYSREKLFRNNYCFSSRCMSATERVFPWDILMKFANLIFTGNCNLLKVIFISFGIKVFLGMTTYSPLLHIDRIIASMCGTISLITNLVPVQSHGRVRFFNNIFGALWDLICDVMVRLDLMSSKSQLDNFLPLKDKQLYQWHCWFECTVYTRPYLLSKEKNTVRKNSSLSCHTDFQLFIEIRHRQVFFCMMDVHIHQYVSHARHNWDIT